MSSKVVLILGAGKNVGKSLIQKFGSDGYKVAFASRTLYPELVSAAAVSVQNDFTNPSTIKSIFEKVRSEVGIPNIVIFNHYTITYAPEENPVLLPISGLENDLAVNVTSFYAAAQEAVAGFDELPKETNKVFIFTGNKLNVQAFPVFLSFGAAKSASAHLINSLSIAYKQKEYKFYYTDERKANGDAIAYDISGDAAAEFYHELVQKKEQGPWLATFVKGIGYVDFHEMKTEFTPLL
ncbi:hypothetical protein B0O99DRAFT_574935 [Bisporella sp. PMI_857]|nr:hypothetical protein B0O99DRAFT_574935 [Bisporella sp. PMI_857]